MTPPMLSWIASDKARKALCREAIWISSCLVFEGVLGPQGASATPPSPFTSLAACLSALRTSATFFTLFITGKTRRGLLWLLNDYSYVLSRLGPALVGQELCKKHD